MANRLYLNTVMGNLVAGLMFFTVLFQPVQLFAQSINTWQAYTSKNAVRELTQDSDGNTWAITDGGMFRYAASDSIDKTWTVLDGMHRLDPTTIIHDVNTDRFLLGYVDGVIDVYDPNDDSFSTLEDISRADQFNSRNINDFVITHDTLMVATDFGVVLYNLQSLLVSDSFSKLGNFNSATKVNQISYTNGVIYAATEAGVAIGSVNTSLSEPDNWNVFRSEDEFDGEPMMRITSYGSYIWATSETTNWRYSKSSGWTSTSLLGNSPIVGYNEDPNNERLYAVSRSHYYVLNGNTIEYSGAMPSQRFAQSVWASRTRENTLWIGTQSTGALIVNFADGSLEEVAPQGPYSNFFNDLTIYNGILVSASSTAFPQASSVNRIKGFYTFDLGSGQWSSFNQQTNNTLQQSRFSMGFSVTATDRYIYSGSWGAGIARLNRESGQIKVYDADNSPLRGIEANENYIVASGLVTDQDQGVWATSFAARTPLYYQPSNGDQWYTLPKSPAVNNSDHYFGIFVDSYGQKWISLRSSENNGRGILVIDTGGDPQDAGDDKSEKLTEDFNDGNLPNAFVNDFAEDRNGEVWVATARGVCRYILPQFIIGGSGTDRRAQWLINADTTAQSPYLLRDVNATSIVVNGANQKWIGTEGDGIWLLDPEGSRILQHFTVENSPLLSNNIISLAIDSSTGTIFIATDLGMVSYTGTAKAPVSKMKDLFIYPNPFSYSKNPDGVVIDDLSEQTTIRIMTVDGTLVNKLQARGGRVRWDGYDFQGEKVATGVYIIVALDREQGQKAVGKIVITR